MKGLPLSEAVLLLLDASILRKRSFIAECDQVVAGAQLVVSCVSSVGGGDAQSFNQVFLQQLLFLTATSWRREKNKAQESRPQTLPSAVVGTGGARFGSDSGGELS